MRALRRLARPAVATAAAVLLLSGCGGDDDGDGSSSAAPSSSASSSSGSSAPESSSGGAGASGTVAPEVAAFCDQAEGFRTAVAQLQTATADQYAGILQQAVADFGQVQPPADIAADSATLGTALQQIADVAASQDLTTPEGEQQFLATAQAAIASAGPAQANVEAYVTGNCSAG